MNYKNIKNFIMCMDSNVTNVNVGVNYVRPMKIFLWYDVDVIMSNKTRLHIEIYNECVTLGDMMIIKNCINNYGGNT